MKDYIKDCLFELYMNVSTNRFGQVNISSHSPSIFGSRKEDVMQWCNENPGVLQFGTYGNRYGTYTAFTIQDAEIRKACSDALKYNESHITNLNSW
jgi:hypothetical protein